MRTNTIIKIAIAATVGLALCLALILPLLALDTRCDAQPWRPQCQTGATTTTLAVTTTTPPASSSSTTTTTTGTLSMPSVSIAGVGCSNTQDSMIDRGAYFDQSSKDKLIAVAAGGHTVEKWAENWRNDWNDRYLGFRPSTGYSGVWLQLCERASAGLTVENVLTIIEMVWDADPDIPVWISPLNFYETEACAVTNGNQIPSEGAVMADELAATMPNVYRGPDLGPLTSSMVRRDNCHPNSAGVTLLGSQLVEFFDE